MRSFWLPAVVLLAITVSLIGSGVRRGHLVADADLESAAAAVRARFQAGDVIVVSPAYMGGPRARLGDLPLLEANPLSPEDLEGFTRVHLLSLDAIGARDTSRSLLASIAKAGEDLEWGGVRLTTFTLAAVWRERFDLRRQIRDVRVTARYADGTRAGCDRFDLDRWLCPRDPGWSWVGSTTLAVDEQPRDCVWMHPLPAGGVLSIALPTLGDLEGRRLRVDYGFALEAARRARAPVSLRVLQGSETLLAATAPVAVGWHRSAIELQAADAPLVIEVETQDNGASHFCAELHILEPGT